MHTLHGLRAIFVLFFSLALQVYLFILFSFPYQQKGAPTFEQNLHIDIYFAVGLSLSTRKKQGNHVTSAQITSSPNPAQLDTIPLLDK